MNFRIEQASVEVSTSNKILDFTIKIDAKATEDVLEFVKKFYLKGTQDRINKLAKANEIYPHCICYLDDNSWEAFITFNEACYETFFIYLKTKGVTNNVNIVDDFKKNVLIEKIGIKEEYIKLEFPYLMENQNLSNLTTKKRTNIIIVIVSVLAAILLAIGSYLEFLDLSKHYVIPTIIVLVILYKLEKFWSNRG